MLGGGSGECDDGENRIIKYAIFDVTSKGLDIQTMYKNGASPLYNRFCLRFLRGERPAEGEHNGTIKKIVPELEYRYPGCTFEYDPSIITR